jgi:hypothetical protein
VAPWAAATVKTQRSEGEREQTRRARLTYALWNSRLSPPLTHTNSSKRTSSPYWLRWFVQRWGPALDRGAHACFPKELRRRKVAASSRFGLWARLAGTASPVACSIHVVTADTSARHNPSPLPPPWRLLQKSHQNPSSRHPRPSPRQNGQSVRPRHCCTPARTRARANNRRPQISHEDEEIIVELLCK